jgi:hypothetical protein
VEEKQAQLEWEARAGRLAAIAAFASVAFVLASTIVQASVGARTTKTSESLRVAHEHSAAITVYAICVALSFLALMPVLLYLYRAAKFRRPEVPSVTAICAILGPILIAVTTIGAIFATLHVANQFVNTGPQTEKHAKDLVRSGALPIFRAVGIPGGLATAIALVLVGLHSMRAGLLSRFMGILGIIAGVLAVIPLAPVPIVQMFWTAALGLLLLNRWPGGRGPAWEAGETVPWPTAQSRRPQPEAGADGEAEPGPRAAPEPAAEPEAVPRQANPNTSRKRRKKKARR